jgi:hypothetical protein
MSEVTLDSNVGCVPGDPITMSADGTCDVAGSNTPIYGIAQGTVTASAGVRQKVNVIRATADAVFSLYADGDGAETIQGDVCDITGGTGATTLQQAVTTNAVVRIMGLHPVSATYGTNAQFYVKIIASQAYGYNSLA